jgi:lysozyme
MDRAIELAAELCRRFEGLHLRAYLCPAAVATIGYGATHYLDGRPVRLTDPPISRDAAERLLIEMLRRTYAPQVLAACPVLARESPERLAAIVDFAFNVGGGALRASTLRRRINAGDWADVPTQLRRWDKAGGRVLRGLTIRREAEARLI